MKARPRTLEQSRFSRPAGTLDRRAKDALDRELGRKSTRPTAGYLLVEYMIYMAVLTVVMGLAFGAFYRCLDNTRDLGRSTEQILSALRAGELWRADIRNAVASPRLVSEGALNACEIPTPGGVIAYVFADGAVWRKQGDGPPRELLSRVRDSKILKDQGQRVTSWRWEVELATRRKNVRLHPLFTFQAVPKGKGL